MFKELVWVDLVSPKTVKSNSFCLIFYFVLLLFIFPRLFLNLTLIGD